MRPSDFTLGLFPSTYGFNSRAALFSGREFSGDATLYGPGGSRRVESPPGSFLAPLDENNAYVEGLLWFPEPDFQGDIRYVVPHSSFVNPFCSGSQSHSSNFCGGVLLVSPNISLPRTGSATTGLLSYSRETQGFGEDDIDTVKSLPCIQTADNPSGFDICQFFAPSTMGSFALPAQTQWSQFQVDVTWHPFETFGTVLDLDERNNPGGGEKFPLKMLDATHSSLPPGTFFEVGFGYWSFAGGGRFRLEAGAEAWLFPTDLNGNQFDRGLVKSLGEPSQHVVGPYEGFAVRTDSGLTWIIMPSSGDSRIPHALAIQPLTEHHPSSNGPDLVTRTYAPGGAGRCNARDCTLRVPAGFKAFAFVNSGYVNTFFGSGMEILGPAERSDRGIPSGSLVASPANIESTADKGQPLIVRDAQGNTRFYDFGYDLSMEVTPGSFLINPGTLALFYPFEGLYGTPVPMVALHFGAELSSHPAVQGARSVVVLPIATVDISEVLAPNGTVISGSDALTANITPGFGGGWGTRHIVLVPKPTPQPSVYTQRRLALPANLGNWLRQARPSGGLWSPGPVQVPASWPETTENAIVYEIDAGEGGIDNVVAHFSVDNGLWVWFDGQFKFGAWDLGPDISPFEHAYISLGDIPPGGKHYIQILRSDLAIRNGWNVLITGNTNGGPPAVDTPGSFFRGNNYFFGGANSEGGSASQTIVAAPNDGAARFIEQGEVVFELSGYVGGHSRVPDPATVTAILKDKDGKELARQSIGPLTPSDRGLVTRLKRLVATGQVPPGTRLVEVRMNLTRITGLNADGYVDDLSFKLLAPVGAYVQDPGLGDTHSGTVDWGDGTVESPLVDQEPGFALLILDHVYPDNGLYPVTVTAQDDDYPSDVHGVITGRVQAASFQVPVSNVAPAVTGVGNFFSVGDPFAGTVATFVDPGLLDAPWTATIDWGDGTISSGDVDQDNKRVTGSHTYTRPGSGPRAEVFANVVVTDKDGDSGTGYMTNMVAFTRLTGVNASPDSAAVNEGGTITGLSGGFTSLLLGFGGVPSDIIYKYTWDYGDGQAFGPVFRGAPMTITSVGGLLGADHIYADNGQFLVRFSVQAFSPSTGKVIAVGSDSFIVTVANLAPVVNTGGNVTASENGKFSRTISYTDGGFEDTHTVLFDWGDGTRSSVGVVNGAARTANASHTYEGDGIFTVTVTVRDDGGTATGTFKVTIPNSAPVTAVGQAQTVAEGHRASLKTSFSDGSTDTHTATVNWGDGSPAEAAEVDQLNDTVKAAHVYADNGAFNVAVCVTDNDRATGCANTTINVTNVLPIVLPEFGRLVKEGEPAVSSSAFFDAGEGDTHTATIDWGDGTSSAAAVDQGQDAVSASHVYADGGIYSVIVRVCDDDGGCSEGTQTMQVINVPVEIVALELRSANPVHIEGLPVTLTVQINDKGTLDSHASTIDWGDGTPVQAGSVVESPFGPLGNSAGANGTVSEVHSYADNGSYNIELCVSDDEAVTCRIERIVINNAPPAVDAGTDITVNEGISINLSPASFTDTGFDSNTIPSQENFTATIAWGDGTSESVRDITLVETPGSVGTPTRGTVRGAHAYGKYGTYTLQVCVADDDHNPEAETPIDGRGCDTLTATVSNVPPQVDAGPDRTWLEGSRFTLNPARFSDVGYASTFTATVDWGDGTSSLPEQVNVATLGGGEGQPVTGTVQATHKYGDNGMYTVEVCVNDGRAGVCDTMAVTIRNVDPSLADTFLQSAITFLSGKDAFLGRKLVKQTHGAPATDPGSDDLTFVWTFLPDLASQTKTYFNNGTGPDALPSPLGTFPFSAADVAPVTFGAPGVYAVKVVVRDDDKGTDFISLPKLVTDNFECTRNHGFWKQQFKASVSGKGRQHINDAALLAYLDIINFASSVFSENTPASTVEQAWAVLWPNKDLDDDDGDPSDKLQKALREALATWLNFARGMVLWDELITVRFGDHDDEPGVTKMFYQWMAEVEGVLLNPTSTHEDYVRAKDIAEDINDSDEDNPACDEDDDDEEGEDKEADKIEDTGKDAEKGEADSGSGDTGKSKKGK